MYVIVSEDKNYISKFVSEIIVEEIKKKKDLSLTLPTGKTPLLLIKEIIKLYQKKKINFNDVVFYMLDEYYPITKNDKYSFNKYLQENFFSQINLKKTNVNILDPETKNVKKACQYHSLKIKKSGIDLCILGIGKNGHIAFNEPGSDIDSVTRVVKLNDETLITNFGKNIIKEKYPQNAMTIGISEIMNSKKIILIAIGKTKSEAVKSMIEKPVNKDCPASFLRNHKNCFILLDKEAAGLLKENK